MLSDAHKTALAADLGVPRDYIFPDHTAVFEAEGADSPWKRAVQQTVSDMKHLKRKRRFNGL
jgi:hypothetical protein